MKSNKTKRINMKNFYSFLFLTAPVIAGALITLLTPGFALAIPGDLTVCVFGSCGDNAGGIADSLCVIVGWFTDEGVGAAIASLAVIFLGIAAFFGKVTWGMAVMFAAGIFAIFGASDIVAAIVPSGLGETSC